MLRSRWFVPIAIFLVCWSLTTHGKYSVTGDEPHYLIVTQSLLADGDLDVRNNYAEGQSVLFGAAGLQPEKLARETRHGQLFPIHDIGVSVALLPVYALARNVSGIVSPVTLERFRMTPGLFTYSIVSLFVIVLTCAAAVLTRSALIAGGLPVAWASVVVLAIWLSPPVLTNSFLVFPEVFAFLVTAWAIRLWTLAPGAISRLQIWAFSLGTGLLPWFHRKFAAYAAFLLIAIVYRHRQTILRWGTPVRLIAVLLFGVPLVAQLWWTQYHWGSMTGALALDESPVSWRALWAGLPGLLVDRENGLFWWTPAFLLLPAAWALSWRRDHVWALWLMVALSLYVVSAAHHQWWGGFSPAARFLFPLVPIFALAAARLTQARVLRRAALVLLVPQLLIAAYCWQFPRAFWPQGDGRNRVLGALLGWFGASDTALPSLRAAAPQWTAALAILAIVAILNAVLYRAALGRRSSNGPQ